MTKRSGRKYQQSKSVAYGAFEIDHGYAVQEDPVEDAQKTQSLMVKGVVSVVAIFGCYFFALHGRR